MQRFIDEFKLLDVKESFKDYMALSEKDGDKEYKTLRKAPLIELTLEEMNSSIIVEGGTEGLLERLEASKVLAGKDEVLDEKKLFPATRELIYTYDFGNNWSITITKERDCRDLLERGFLSNEEIACANEIVLDKHRPVCIHKDGVFLLDDVGGASGFADFLGTVYESEDKEEKDGLFTWAKSLGWNEKKIANKRVL